MIGSSPQNFFPQHITLVCTVLLLWLWEFFAFHLPDPMVVSSLEKHSAYRSPSMHAHLLGQAVMGCCAGWSGVQDAAGKVILSVILSAVWHRLSLAFLSTESSAFVDLVCSPCAELQQFPAHSWPGCWPVMWGAVYQQHVSFGLAGCPLDLFGQHPPTGLVLWFSELSESDVHRAAATDACCLFYATLCCLVHQTFDMFTRGVYRLL